MCKNYKYIFLPISFAINSKSKFFSTNSRLNKKIPSSHKYIGYIKGSKGLKRTQPKYCVTVAYDATKYHLEDVMSRIVR